MCDVITSSFSKFENRGIQSLQSLRLSLDFDLRYSQKEELCVPRLPTLRSTATNQTRRAACRATRRRRRRTLPCLASLFFRQTRSGSSLNILFVLCPRSSRVPRTHELARPARRATALRCFHFCFCTKHCKQTPRRRRTHSALCACFSGTTAKHKMYSVPVVASMYVQEHRWLS
jgi:hypothetical protein